MKGSRIVAAIYLVAGIWLLGLSIIASRFLWLYELDIAGVGGKWWQWREFTLMYWLIPASLIGLGLWEFSKKE
ncbi:MAG: hypothetical protein PWQ86_1768 [Bacillota bacterium]|jgi:hypothetical protein|nr:hypothetical protein [Bacillota bacterium]